MRNAMAKDMSNGSTGEHETDATYITLTDQPQSIVITPQGRPVDVEPKELPRCLRQGQQMVRPRGRLTTIKRTFGLSEMTPVVTRQLPTMAPLLPPPLPADGADKFNSNPLQRISPYIRSAKFKNLNLIGITVAAGLSAAGIVGFYTNGPTVGEEQSAQRNSNETIAQASGAGTIALDLSTDNVEVDPSSAANTPAGTIANSNSVEDLQLATSTAGDALEAPGESTGILAAVTHNFGPGRTSGSFEPVATSPTLVPTGPRRLVETLANAGSRPPVRLDAVIAAPRSITVTRGTRRLLPVLLASPDYAAQIRTLSIVGLPKTAELSAASRDGLGGWVLVPEALGIAELTLPKEIEGMFELTIKAFGSSSNPVGIAVMKMSVTGGSVEPEQAKSAHKSIAEALVLFERGDVDGARGLLSAIVDVGNPHAAYVFAETFDPAGLSERAVNNAKADVERARFWYQRAQKGGYSKAAERLAILPRITQEVMIQDKSGQ